MEVVIRVLKFLLVSILAIVLWPIQTFFVWYQGKHQKWQKEDKISYYLSIPFYWIIFSIFMLLTLPLNMIGEELAPPQVKGFK